MKSYSRQEYIYDKRKIGFRRDSHYFLIIKLPFEVN